MITKQDLLDWLNEVDQRLNHEIVLVAAGGTAMTLLNLKESTRDVDFCVPESDFEEFKRLSHTNLFKVDIFHSSYIVALQLPPDYVTLAQDYPYPFKHLHLKTLKPEDIIVTKTSRLNARDIEDIKSLAKSGKVDLGFLKKRFEEVKDTYAGREDDYAYHFQLVLEWFFSGEIKK